MRTDTHTPGYKCTRCNGTGKDPLYGGPCQKCGGDGKGHHPGGGR